MTLEVGATLGHYEVLGTLGAGGMGEVYRARDAKLGREVAIKVLPPAVVDDPERLARFEREARALAALNHPNVATLFGMESHEGTPFLVMEVAHGPTLAERLDEGPVPLSEAIEIFTQLADGLAAAHARGIVHRDLKPANVKISAEGAVKILDFGLATVFDEERDESEAGLTRSPTLTARMSRAGTILGTAAYMSPEQARGQEADARSDVWAFGVMLWETITRRRLFEEPTVSDTLAAVLRAEIDTESLPPTTPDPLRRLLRRCLERDPSRRLHSIADARLELLDASAEPAEGRIARQHADASAPKSQRFRLLMATGLLLLGAALGLVVRQVGFGPGEARTTAGPTVQFDWTLPGAEEILRSAPAVSPDGSTFAAVLAPRGAVEGIVIRRLDQVDVEPLPFAGESWQPFFSPDGRWLAFWAEEKLWKIALGDEAGRGVAQEITDFHFYESAAWTERDEILLRRGRALHRLSAVDGRALPFGEADEIAGLGDPYPLPGAAVALVTDTRDREPRLAALRLETGEIVDLGLAGSSPHFLEPGLLVFRSGPSLTAVRFDPARVEIVGDPREVLGELDGSVGAPFDLSPSGTLIYTPTRARPSTRAPAVREPGTPRGNQSVERLVWVSPGGEITPSGLEVPRYSELLRSRGVLLHVALSPDENRVAVTYDDQSSPLSSPASRSGSDFSLHVYDLDRRTFTPLTERGRGGLSMSPRWSRDGREIYFSAALDDDPGNTGTDVFRQPIDLSAPAERIIERPTRQMVTAVGPGDRLLFTDYSTGSQDVWLYDPADGSTRALFDEDYDEMMAVFSPDGRWVAYSSYRTGSYEIWVRPIDGSGPGIAVTSSGGAVPVWKDERLYFARIPGALLSVEITTEPELRIGEETVHLPDGFPRAVQAANYDVARDGRILLSDTLLQLAPGERVLPAAYRVIVGFGALVDEQLPTSGADRESR